MIHRVLHVTAIRFPKRLYMNALEELIRQAIESGKFNNLQGQGKPILLEENPLEDPEWRLANLILANSGFSPGWVQKRRDIENDLESARKDIRRAWARCQSNTSADSAPDFPIDEWQRAQEHFSLQVEELNKRIGDYNLETPLPQLQHCGINFQAELDRITTE